MKTGQLKVHEFPEGLRVVVEPIPCAHTVAIQMRGDFGAKDDPPGCRGWVALAESSAMLGAKRWSPRRIIDTLDKLGVDRESMTSTEYVSFNITCTPEAIPEVLKLYSEVLRAPRFHPGQVNIARSLQIESLAMEKDQPARRVAHVASAAVLGPRLGGSPLGVPSSLRRATHSELARIWNRFAPPRNWQIVLAGAVEEEDALAMVRRAFGRGHIGSPASSSRPRFSFRRVSKHVHASTEHTYLCITYEAAPRNHRLFYAGLLVAALLSGGSSGRLFCEIRERRGLAYAVNTQYRSWRGGATLTIHANTRPASSSLLSNACRDEMARLKRIWRAEIERAKAILKAGVLISRDIPDARAAVIADQLFLTGQPLSPRESLARIDELSRKHVYEYLEAFPVSDPAVISMGP